MEEILRRRIVQGRRGAVVEFYTSTRHHVHVFFRFNDEDPCSRSSFFTIPFSLSLSFLLSGENALHATPFPSGVCSYCCPIDVNRDIEYLLYTRWVRKRIRSRLDLTGWKFRRRNPNCGATLNISDPYSLRRSNFNDRYPTVIFIHGYSESATGRSAVAIRDGTFTIIITIV